MAKKVNGVDGKKATGVEAIRGNGFDPEVTQEIVDRIEEVQNQVDTIMDAAKDKTSPLREDIDAIKKEAHEAGLPRKELNEALAKRRALRRIEQREARLSDEQRDNFHQLELALGMISEMPKKPPRAASANGTEAHA